MQKNTASRIPGKYGCLFQAHPGRVYWQFCSYATASLFYDFVAVADLDWCIAAHSPSDDHHSPTMLKTFQRMRDHGIALDGQSAARNLAPVLDREVLTVGYGSADKAAHALSALHQANNATEQATAAYNKFLDTIRASKGDQVFIPPELDAEHFRLSSSRARTLSEYTSLLCKTSFGCSGYEIDDGRPMQDEWTAPNTEALREAIRAGRIPIAHVPDAPTVPIRSGEELRTFSLVLKAVPFPIDMPPDEFIDFRNDKKVRASIGRFRQLAGELVGEGQAPPYYVVSEILDQYDEYKKTISKTRTKTVLSNVRFVASNIAGLFEDAVKLRLESFTKRPFDVIEYFIDRKYRDRSHENSPFYFLLEKDPAARKL